MFKFVRAPWRTAGCILLSATGAACAPGVAPVPTEVARQVRVAIDTAAPPQIAGVRLGQSLEAALAALGSPTFQRELIGGAVELAYDHRGLVIVTTPDQGVALIGLLSPIAPDLSGVRIGDPITHVLEQWGEPHSTGPGSMAYDFGEWGILVSEDVAEGIRRVEHVTIGWSKKKSDRSIVPPWPTRPDTLR